MNNRFRPLVLITGYVTGACLLLSLVCFSIALVAALLGFGAIAEMASAAMKIVGLITLLAIFSFLCVVIISLAAGRTIPRKDEPAEK